MKEQLVEMTGLSPRVIRVWFQNKRCKDKKKASIILKPQNPNQQASSDELQVLGRACYFYSVHPWVPSARLFLIKSFMKLNSKTRSLYVAITTKQPNFVGLLELF